MRNSTSFATLAASLAWFTALSPMVHDALPRARLESISVSSWERRPAHGSRPTASLWRRRRKAQGSLVFQKLEVGNTRRIVAHLDCGAADREEFA